MRDMLTKNAIPLKSTNAWKLMWDAKHSLCEIMEKRETPKIQIHSLDAINHKIEEVKEAAGTASRISNQNVNLHNGVSSISQEFSECGENTSWWIDSSAQYYRFGDTSRNSIFIKFCSLWSTQLTKNNTKLNDSQMLCDECRWINPELPTIKELIAIKKSRKRRANEFKRVLIPQKFDKNNVFCWQNPSNFSKEQNLNKTDISKKSLKRFSKSDLKQEQNIYNPETEFRMKILQNRVDNHINHLSGVFKRLRLEGDDAWYRSSSS